MKGSQRHGDDVDSVVVLVLIEVRAVFGFVHIVSFWYFYEHGFFSGHAVERNVRLEDTAWLPESFVGRDEVAEIRH